MNENTTRSLRDHCLRVMGRDPMADGATFDEAKRDLEQHIQREGAAVHAIYSESFTRQLFPSDIAVLARAHGIVLPATIEGDQGREMRAAWAAKHCGEFNPLCARLDCKRERKCQYANDPLPPRMACAVSGWPCYLETCVAPGKCQRMKE